MISDFGEKENQGPITEKSRLNIPMLLGVQVVGAIFWAAVGYGGTVQAINEKITKDEARKIAAEVVQDKTAVLSEKVSKLEEAVKDLASENKETNKLIRQLIGKE